jgi:hypothetical protein
VFRSTQPLELIKQHPGLAVVLEAISETGASDAERKTLTTIILVRASEAARRLLEGMMTTMEWKSDFIESYVDQGRVLDRREVVLKILNARDLHPTEEQRARVAASTDLGQLELWFERSLTAATATDVFND